MFDTKPVDITEILTMDVDLSELYIDVEETEDDQTCSKESPVDMTFSVEEEIPENVLRVCVFTRIIFVLFCL